MKSAKQIIFTGTVLMFLAIVIGAFGAHALKNTISDPNLLASYHTGAQYQVYHALALVMLGLWAAQKETRKAAPVAFCFIAGIVLFSGSLYTLALTNIKMLGAITPFGGLSFMLGWILWSIKTWREQ